DPITVETSTGKIVIQPQRTNNILERFFRDLKRGHRKKSGAVSLNRTIRSILSDTPLVKNLDNPEYMKILLGDCHTIAQRFEKIDSAIVHERLKTEARKTERISPAMKKIVRFPDLPEKMLSLMA
ncbi:MAG: transposase, partial [Desulfobacterales bacterium]|nr:transposase [Desulfobacterales bacterium]